MGEVGPEASIAELVALPGGIQLSPESLDDSSTEGRLRRILETLPKDSPLRKRYLFLSSVEHEIGNPLNLLNGYLFFLRQEQGEVGKEVEKSEDLFEANFKEILAIKKTLKKNRARIVVEQGLVKVYRDLRVEEKDIPNKPSADHLGSLAVRRMEDLFKGCGELIGSFTPDEGEGREFCQKMANRVRTGLENLKIFHGYLTGDYQLEPQPVGLKKAVDSEIGITQRNLFNLVRARERDSLEIEIDGLEELEGRQITADPYLFGVILRNLLERAVQQSQGKADLKVEEVDDNWLFVWKNKNEELSEDEQAVLFARTPARDDLEFFTRQELGLWLCKEIIEAHGGKIWLELKDRTPTFRFTLPRTNEQTS